jgi:hypothetical protein
MNSKTGRRIQILIPVVFALLVPSSAAFAQADAHGLAVELFGGYFAGYSSTNGLTIHEDTLGVRGSYRFTRVWAVEAAVSRMNESSFTFWNEELSAKAYLFQRDRFGLFALAGPGVQRLKFAGSSPNAKTVHAGIGADIALSEKLYLRPEILARWPYDFLNDRYRETDYTIGIGWRF